MNPTVKAAGVAALSLAGLGLGTWSAVSLHRLSRAHQSIAESGIDLGIGEDMYQKLTMELGESENEQPPAEETEEEV